MGDYVGLLLVGSTTLDEGMGSQDLTLRLTSSRQADPGRWLQIGREKMVITAKDDRLVTVRRGQDGTAGLPHTAGTVVQILVG